MLAATAGIYVQFQGWAEGIQSSLPHTFTPPLKLSLSPSLPQTTVLQGVNSQPAQPPPSAPEILATSS